MTSGFFQKALFALVFLGVGSVGTLAGSALATPGDRSGGGRSGRSGGGKAAMIEKLVQDLNLDASQMAKGQEVKARITERMRNTRQDRGAAFEELANELGSDRIDRKAVYRIADRRMDVMEQNIHASIDDVLEFVDTLDPQQKETLINDIRTMKSASGSRRATRAAAPE
jgi:hypothetical protein